MDFVLPGPREMPLSAGDGVVRKQKRPAVGRARCIFSGEKGYFTSDRPVIASRFPYMIAFRFFFDMSMLSRIFKVSRM